MALPILATPTLSDLAALTGGPVAGSMPLSNLQTQQPSLPTRWTDLSQVYAVWDLGAPYNLNLLTLRYANATEAATIRWRGATSPSALTASPGYDSGALAFWPATNLDVGGYTRFHSWLYSLAGFGAYRYWRMDVADATNPKTYFQAGRAILASIDSGTLYVFARGVAPGGTVGPREAPTRLQTAGGQTYPTVNPKTDAEKFTVPCVTEADALKEIGAIRRTRGVSRAVLYSRDPGDLVYATEKSVYGLLTLEDAPYIGWQEGVKDGNGATTVRGSICYNVSGLIEELP